MPQLTPMRSGHRAVTTPNRRKPQPIAATQGATSALRSGLMMRAFRGATILIVTALLMLADPEVAAGQSGSTDHEVVQPRALAVEVCEDMVADAVETMTRAPLPQPQEGRWRGRRYTCDYELDAGRLRLTVAYTPTLEESRSTFATTKNGAQRPTDLFGIGGEAFQHRRSKAIVARKDNFILTVDPSRLDLPASGRDVLALAATRAVFDCW